MDSSAPALLSGLPSEWVAGIFTLGGVLIVGLLGLVFWFGRHEIKKHGQQMQAVSDFLQRQPEKEVERERVYTERNGLLLERLSVISERLASQEKAWETLQERLRDGSKAMQSLRERQEEEKACREKFEQALREQQSKFEQEVHTRQLAFAGQWQTTLVDLSNRFVSREAMVEYRQRHEQDHDRMETRMAHQEQAVEKMAQNVLGIEKKLEGGIHTIAALLAKHVTIGPPKGPSESEG